MGTGFRGTFVISWSQTEVDGLKAAPLGALSVGATWSWHGELVRVDGPTGVLRLDSADGEAELRKRAARMVRRLVGAATQHRTDVENIEVDEPLMDCGFLVTDGRDSYKVTLIEVSADRDPLVMFHDSIPPRDRRLWVVHHAAGRPPRNEALDGGVICFTPGTRISTPSGPRLVQELRQGDLVLTRDSGPQEVLWIGNRRITGARLQVAPQLRPIRFQPGALGIERPDQALVVSPQHRMLVRGRQAQALFNTDEVLVAAQELVNGNTISVDRSMREVSYIHLMLPRHHILWANGVETESFHPASTSLTSLTQADRDRLLAMLPELDFDPHSYGEFARRSLSKSEAAILRHEAA